MPKLNDNEKRLGAILGIGLFLLANGLGYIFVKQQMEDLARQETLLKTRKSELSNAAAMAAEADLKREWMEEHLLPAPDEANRDTYLDQFVNGKLTQGLDVELSKMSALPTVTTDNFVKGRFKVTARGSWPEVKEMLHRLQKPEDMHFVPTLSMIPKKSEEDDSVQLAEVTLEIEKWWAKTDETVVEETAPAFANNEQPAGSVVQPDAPSEVAPPAPAPAPAEPAPADAPPDATPNQNQPAAAVPPPAADPNKPTS